MELFDTLFEEEAFTTITQTLKTWETDLNLLKDFYSEFLQVEKQNLKNFQKMITLLKADTIVSNELRVYSERNVTACATFCNFVETETLAKVALLLKIVKKTEKKFSQEFQEKKQALKQYEQILVNRNRISSDDWINEQNLLCFLDLYIKEREIYGTMTKQWLEEIGKEVERIAEQTRCILADFFIVKSKQSLLDEEYLTELRRGFESLNDSKMKDLSQYWKSVSKEDYYNLHKYIFHDKQNLGIARSGLMMRSGRLRRTNWHPAFYILTDTGYLHWYDISRKEMPKKLRTRTQVATVNTDLATQFLKDNQRLRKPTGSLCLDVCEMGIVQPAECVLEILEKQIGVLFSSDRKIWIKAFLEEDLIDWYCEIKKCTLNRNSEMVAGALQDSTDLAKVKESSEESNESKEDKLEDIGIHVNTSHPNSLENAMYGLNFSPSVDEEFPPNQFSEGFTSDIGEDPWKN